MDLLTGSLIAGTGYALFETIRLIENKTSFIDGKWTKLVKSVNLEGFKLIRKTKTRTGYILKIKLEAGCETEMLEKIINKIEKYYQCRCVIQDIQFSNTCNVEIITKNIDFLPYQKLLLKETQLLIGHDFTGKPIVVDMDVTTHLGVVGISNSGKSTCIETALFNIKDKIDITLINCMSKNFKSLGAVRRINVIDNITNYLKNIKKEGIRDKPLFVVIDEYNVLSRVKGMDLIIQDLLSQARHFNIYLIVLMQLGNKEDCKFKNLFGSRLAFRTLEQQTLMAFLNANTERKLFNREFYLHSDDIYTGRTYTF